MIKTYGFNVSNVLFTKIDGFTTKASVNAYYDFKNSFIKQNVGDFYMIIDLSDWHLVNSDSIDDIRRNQQYEIEMGRKALLLITNDSYVVHLSRNAIFNSDLKDEDVFEVENIQAALARTDLIAEERHLFIEEYTKMKEDIRCNNLKSKYIIVYDY
jgi:hypothetical protein